MTTNLAERGVLPMPVAARWPEIALETTRARVSAGASSVPVTGIEPASL